MIAIRPDCGASPHSCSPGDARSRRHAAAAATALTARAGVAPAAPAPVGAARRPRVARRRRPASLNVVFIPKAINNPYFDAAASAPRRRPTSSAVSSKQIGPQNVDERPSRCRSSRTLPRRATRRSRLGDRRRRGRPGAEGGEGCRNQGRRLRLEPGRRRLRRLRQPDRLQPHRRRHGAVGLRARPGCTRRDRDPFGDRHGDQPERLDRGLQTRPSPTTPKFAKPRARRHRLRRRRRDQEPGAANGLLTNHPNLKVIVAPTTVGILAAAQVVKQAASTVKVTGLGLPNDMKAFVADGMPEFGLWSVPDLGYLAYYVAAKLITRRDHGHPARRSRSPPRTTTSRTRSARKSSSSSAAIRLRKDNVDDFDF